MKGNGDTVQTRSAMQKLEY